MSGAGTARRCEHCFGPLKHGECAACAPRLQRRALARIADALEAIARAFEPPAQPPMFCAHGAPTTGVFESQPVSAHCRACMADPRLRAAIETFERMSQDIGRAAPATPRRYSDRPGR